MLADRDCVFAATLPAWRPLLHLQQEDAPCCNSIYNLLSSSLLSKNINIKEYRAMILSVVLYVCETWSLTLREECRLSVLENRVLRRKFGAKKKVTGSGEDLIMRSLLICTPHQIFR
jgi:hypothetical protein